MSILTIPDRYRYAVIPHVMVRDAAEALAWYTHAFGAMELFRIALPTGQIIHAELRVGQSVVMVGDADGPFQDAQALGGASVALHVYVENVDVLVAQALRAGAHEVQPVQTMFYGARTAMLRDPYGHIWVVLTQHEDLSPDEILIRAKAALGQ